MTNWTPDYSLDAPDGHVWLKPQAEDCPKCPCHTAVVCTGGLWNMAGTPTYKDGTPYRESCVCQTAAAVRG